ncbi:MAG: hypothetical protein AAB907_00515, partial [Patescibacteria group bacterium]
HHHAHSDILLFRFLAGMRQGLDGQHFLNEFQSHPIHGVLQPCNCCGTQTAVPQDYLLADPTRRAASRKTQKTLTSSSFAHPPQGFRNFCN